MSLLSDLPDDILRLISFRLNGFDNCSLWMASGSQLRQRLVNNVIIDFNIKYTIPGRYLWPGNFLKRLSKLSRLSLVVDENAYHLPLQDAEVFPIPTLKYLKLGFSKSYRMFERTRLSLSNNPTGPRTSSNNQYFHLNDLYPNLEHLEIITTWAEAAPFSIDFLGCLPQNLQTLSIPRTLLKFKLPLPPKTIDTTAYFNKYIEMLPRTLTKLDVKFGFASKKPDFDLTKLPPNLTSLITNACIDEKSYDLIPRSLKKLILSEKVYNINKLSPFLPTGLESLDVDIHQDPPTSQTFAHMKNIQSLTLRASELISMNDLISKCPPKLKKFRCSFFEVADLPLPNILLGNSINTLELNHIIGIRAEFISLLPQSLTDLTMVKDTKQESFAFFSLLPRNLKSLHTDFAVLQNTSLLPESLKNFRLLTTKSPDASYFDILPLKLETFIAKPKLPISIMKQLPPNLKELSLISDEVVDDEIVRMLPRGLKRLFLDTVDEITDAAAVSDLPPYLETLFLLNNTNMTDDAISLLPRTLTHLALPRNPNFTDECIKHLPRKLGILFLNQASEITSNSCRDLPKYLKVLKLSSSWDWDLEMLNESKSELPRFIKHLVLGNSKVIKRWTEIVNGLNDGES